MMVSCEYVIVIDVYSTSDPSSGEEEEEEETTKAHTKEAQLFSYWKNVKELTYSSEHFILCSW